MRLLLTLGLALLLLSVHSVALKTLGAGAVRVDVTVLLVAFLALRASTLEGALGSYALGYLLDMTSGRPTGLYTFLGVFCFLLGRLGGSLVDVRSALAFALFVAGLDLAHGLFATFLSWLTSKSAEAAWGLSTLPWQVGLTTLTALILYPLLRRIDAGHERPEVGTLR
jgi:hypothetical protein